MAKQTSVKCVICNESIPRDGTVEYVNTSVNGYRYAHKACVKKQEEKQVVRNQIHILAQRFLGSTYNKSRVENQIQSLLKEGKTEIGILNALEYWYDVKKGDPSKAAGGIGIVKYIYGEALDYRQKMDEIRERNQNLDLSQFIVPETEHYQFTPKPIKRPKRVKLFDLR